MKCYLFDVKSLPAPMLGYTPFYRGCDRCASLVRPQNWPGRRWRHKWCRKVALVVQGWHRERSDLAMDAMVTVKFWACSKQSHKGRRGGQSLKGGRRKAHASQWSQNVCTGVGHWSHRKKIYTVVNIVYQLQRWFCLPCTTIVPPLADPCVLWAIILATTVPPFGDHGNSWATMAMVLPPLCLLCATCCATVKFWSFKESTGVVLQLLHRNRTF